MLGNFQRESRQTKLADSTHPKRTLQQVQDAIYTYLLSLVQEQSPEEVLTEFKHLFIHQVNARDEEARDAVCQIILENQENEFRYTVQRSCYILINNWEAYRQYQYIQSLIELFEDPVIERDTFSPTLKRLRSWLKNFVASPSYEELRLFIARFEVEAGEEEEKSWTRRYTSYLLVPQYIDLKNPVEQRESARALSKKLREKFKFDLAMYTARSQSGLPTTGTRNPTSLGDDVLRLIKTIVVRRGKFSYSNLAHLFLNQTDNLYYKRFKKSLQKYLIFSIESKDFVNTLKTQLNKKLAPLYEDYHYDPIDDALRLRTCNRAIEFLTTENYQEPSPLFVLLLSQGNPLTLAIALLKLLLISRNSRTHLEACIAALIRYYEPFPKETCQWFINFLEIFNITLAIYADNVEFNLVQVSDHGTSDRQVIDIDTYRIFSQLRDEEEQLQEMQENGTGGDRDSRDSDDSIHFDDTSSSSGDDSNLRNTIDFEQASANR